MLGRSLSAAKIRSRIASTGAGACSPRGSSAKAVRTGNVAPGCAYSPQPTASKHTPSVAAYAQSAATRDAGILSRTTAVFEAVAEVAVGGALHEGLGAAEFHLGTANLRHVHVGFAQQHGAQ